MGTCKYYSCLINIRTNQISNPETTNSEFVVCFDLLKTDFCLRIKIPRENFSTLGINKLVFKKKNRICNFRIGCLI